MGAYDKLSSSCGCVCALPYVDTTFISRVVRQLKMHTNPSHDVHENCNPYCISALQVPRFWQMIDSRNIRRFNAICLSPHPSWLWIAIHATWTLTTHDSHTLNKLAIQSRPVGILRRGWQKRSLAKRKCHPLFGIRFYSCIYGQKYQFV